MNLELLRFLMIKSLIFCPANSLYLKKKSSKSISSDKSFRDIAILCRLNAQMNVIKEKLEKRGIPFRMIDSKPFFKEAEIKTAYYWIRVATSRDQVDFLSLLKGTKGIGKSTLLKFEQAVLFSNHDLLELIDNTDISPKLDKKVRKIIEDIESFSEKAKENGIATSLKGAMAYLAIDQEKPGPKRILELAGVFGHDLSNSLSKVYETYKDY